MNVHRTTDLVSSFKRRYPRALCFAGWTFLLLLSAGCSDASTGGGPEADITVTFSDITGTVCTVDSDCADAFPDLLKCEIPVCLPSNGVCTIETLANGTSCKDGFACTGPDFCVNGECGGGPRDCDDDDPCTADSCDGKVGCVYAPESGVDCDDGYLCTSGDSCVEGLCQGEFTVEGCCTYDGDCDDGQLCTEDACDENQCSHAFNFAPCDDQNPCTLKDNCGGDGACGGDELICEDGNPCTLDVCNSDNGTCESTAADDGTACEDGNPCTTPDICDNGLCEGQGSLCQCTADADCVPFEDSDLCNGTLKCLDFACVVDPITVIACNPTGDTQCAKNICDPVTAQCAPKALGNGSVCDDQNPCTDLDQCTNGLCIGAGATCDDANACTFDSCSPVTGCQYVPHTQPCDDGNACTANDQCGEAVCSGQVIQCNDFNACSDNTCDSVTGCVYTSNNANCDDGNPCTSDDVCLDGSCESGSNTCECATDQDCAAQEDNNFCNGTLVCTNAQCVVDASSVVTCDTDGDGPCLQTACDAGSGLCIANPSGNGMLCNDDNACTVGDNCSAGNCVGTDAVCDDDNGCTDDVCDNLQGCIYTPNNATCNDGDLCTGNDTCTAGACGGVSIQCDDGNQCTVDTCDPVTGCAATPAANNTSCNDSNICTHPDLCMNAACSGAPLACDDGNECTQNLCGAADGCNNPPVVNATPCDDGSECSQGDQCTDGECLGNPPSCDDGNPCTTDICDNKKGCTYGNAVDGTACTDGDPCTGGDACVNGLCLPGNAICECQSDMDCAVEEDGDLCNGTLYCSPNNTCKLDPNTVVTCDLGPDPCETFICIPETGGCAAQNGADGVVCDDTDGCTINDTCQAGICTGFGTSCNDDNPCTADTCENDACTYNPAFDGTPCLDDGNPCTLDICQEGSCGSVALADGQACADDGNACTTDTCWKGDCAHNPVEDALPCTDDGNACTYDQCTGGTCQHISNDPPPIGPDECFAVAELKAGGKVAGSWNACGVADQFDFNCKGPNCSKTGAIDKWDCATQGFLYDGANTGYEYTYIFVAPVTGKCTLIEYNEGSKVQGNLFGVIDWFILEGTDGCKQGSCIDYMWENVTGDPMCGPGNKPCSYKSFSVTEGQSFYIVADIFDGAGAHQTYDFNTDWSIEITCDDNQALLLNEDFTDGVCSGCIESTNAGNQCTDFGWHPVGSFGDVVTGYYLGQMSANSLAGYDCGATDATLTFPTSNLPANATSCSLSFTYYADYDAADDGDCTNDILEIQLAVDNGPATPINGDSCAANTNASNPLGSDANPTSKTITYDLSAYVGSAVDVGFYWSADAQNNNGLGVIIDNVVLTCELP